MAAIVYRQGNLLESPLKIIAHGCNAHGVMGSGIARQIRAKWPNVFEVYELRHKTFGLELGEVIPVATLDGRIVLNCITQSNYGRTGGQFVDYSAIEQCFELINEKAPDWEATEIGMPRIGAGLGGGDWAMIESIIIKTSKTYTPIVYDFYVPDPK